MTYQRDRELKGFAAKPGRFNRWALCLTASALAIAAAMPALAQTTVLTSTSSNYDLLTHAGTDQYVEVSSGTHAYVMEGDSYGYSNSGNPRAPIPAGGVGILYVVGGNWQNGIGSTGSAGSSLGWFYVPSNAPVIKDDAGATVTVAGRELIGPKWNADYANPANPGAYNQTPEMYFWGMFQSNGGEVQFGEGRWTVWGPNHFTNLTLLDNARLRSGGGFEPWGGCCGSSALTVVDGWLAGASTSTLEVNGSSVTVNGANNSAHAFTGTVNVRPGGIFVVGDSTHASAVFGDPVGRAAQINVTGTLTGYGTIYGNVTNGSATAGGTINSGGTAGVNGGLTINGNLTLTNNSLVATSMTTTGVSGVVVSGNMMAAGELDVTIAPGNYGNGVFPLLTVNGGAITGAFSRVHTFGSVGDVVTGLLQTSSGFTIVTEKGTSAQVYGHLLYANRMAITNFVGSVYDAMAMTPSSGAKVDTWITPIGEIENISRNDQGYEQKTYGLSGGAMHRFERHGGVIGVAVSYRHGDMSVKGSADRARTNAYDFAVYGGADVNELRFEGSAFYNLLSADAKRPMGTFGTPVSSQNGYAYGVSGQISHDMFRSLLTPYVRGMYGRNHLEAGKETGSAMFALQHQAVNLNTFIVDVGMRVHLLNPVPDRRIKVDAGLAWRHDLSDPGETVNVSFANFTGGNNTYFWRGDSKNAAVMDMNVAGDVTDQMEVYGRLGGTFTSHRRAGELSLGVKYKF